MDVEVGAHSFHDEKSHSRQPNGDKLTTSLPEARQQQYKREGPSVCPPVGGHTQMGQNAQGQLQFHVLAMHKAEKSGSRNLH